jgi:hypothetical protein
VTSVIRAISISKSVRAELLEAILREGNLTTLIFHPEGFDRMRVILCKDQRAKYPLRPDYFVDIAEVPPRESIIKSKRHPPKNHYEIRKISLEGKLLYFEPTILKE